MFLSGSINFKRVDDDSLSGRLLTSISDENIMKIRNLVRSSRRFTIREMAGVSNVNFYAVQSILTEDLEVRWVFTKFISKVSDERKERLLQVSQEVFNRVENDPDSCAWLSKLQISV